MFGGLTLAAASTGGRSTREAIGRWYVRLRKPPFQPPPWVFGPAWAFLYATSAVAGWRVWQARRSPQRTKALALWGAQLGLNALWSPLFFGRRLARLALADCVALTFTARAFRSTARPIDATAARLMTPCVAWTSFATLLNEEMVRLNGKTTPDLA